MAKLEPFRSLGFAAIDWIETFLVHGPGDVQGQPIELDDEFAAFTLKAYKASSKGQREVRRAFLSRAKGRNKSGFAAMLECFEALGPCRFDHWAEAGEVSDWGYGYEVGEPVGRPLTYVEILNVATEEGQAGNTYDAVYYMLSPETCSPELLAMYGKLDVGLTRINLPGSRGFIEPVTASNESKDGGKSTFIVADETHLWIPPVSGKFKLGKMHQTMVRNLLKRKIASGWMLETSTMYADGEGSVAEGTHAYAKAVEASGRKDGKLLFDHRQASMDWDLSKRSERIKALKEAYGPAAPWTDLEAIADYWDDPQASEADFRRFFLNQPVSTVAPKISVLPGWPDCRTAVAEWPEVLAIGIGVSLGQEWSSIVAAGRWEDGRTFVAPSYSDTQEIDRHSGTAWLVGRAKEIQDRHGCRVFMDSKCPDSGLAKRLREAGVTALELDTDQMCEACSGLLTATTNVDVAHPGDVDLDDHVKAAVKRDVGDGRWMWGRRRSGEPIDLLEAATVAHWGADQDIDVWEVWT